LARWQQREQLQGVLDMPLPEPGGILRGDQVDPPIPSQEQFGEGVEALRCFT
jgi:hypothetical protein